MILLVSICSSISLCYFLYVVFGIDAGLIIILGVLLGCLLRIVYLAKDIRDLLEGSSIGKEWTKNFLLNEKKEIVRAKKVSTK